MDEPSFPEKKTPTLPAFLPPLQQCLPDSPGRVHSVPENRAAPTTDSVPLLFPAVERTGITIIRPGWKYITATYHRSGMFFQPLHEQSNRLESLIANQSNKENRLVKINAGLMIPDVTDFSVSTSVNDILGITLEASSSISKQSMVAMKPINPATRA